MVVHICYRYSDWLLPIFFTEEREIAEMKEEISQAFKHDLRSVNQEDHKFWKDLLHACLEPYLDAFGSEEILKGEH